MEVALPLDKEVCFRVIPDRANLQRIVNRYVLLAD